MTILCAGETHVYLVGQPYCTCGGQINAPPNEVPLYIFKAALAMEPPAMYLRADGKRAYRTRYGITFEAGWQAGIGTFSAWWPMPEGAEMPADAVAIED